MSTIPSGFGRHFQQATQDRHLEKQEAKSLQAALAQENLSPADRQGLSKVVQRIEDTTHTGRRLFSNDRLSPKEYAQISGALGKLQNTQLAHEIREATLKMIADPQERNEAQARARGVFNPKGVHFGQKQAHNPWHTRQYADYDAKYGDGSYFKDHANKTSLTGERARLHQQAGSSCGPTCTLMVLKSHGMAGDIQGIGEIRAAMNQIDKRVSPHKGAIDPEPIAKSLNRLSKGQLQATVHREKVEGMANAEDMLQRMKRDLDQDKSVILLTQYMDNNPESIGNTGHYVVVTGINPDQSLQLADPYNPNASSQVSFAEFESVFKHRQAFGKTQAQSRPNAYIAVSRP